MDKAHRYPNIDAERVKHRMTVQELAACLGVSRKTYYNWCKFGNIPQEKLEKLADIFNASIDYLLNKGA